MLALFAVFEHLSNVRRLLNRFHLRYTTPAAPAAAGKVDECALLSTASPSSSVQESQREILLAPVVNSILSDDRLEHFDDDFRDELSKDEAFARELDACLLEMRDIERDLYNFKQRQCCFYEHYLDFIDKKDRLIDMFIEYHDEYLLGDSSPSASPTKKQRSTKYEFNIPVSNRFDLLKRHSHRPTTH